MLTATADGGVLEREALDHASPAEWRTVCNHSHNILLEGPQISTAAVTAFVGPYLHGPVGWNANRETVRSSNDRGGCAIVVQGVAALSASEQARLLVWLNEPSERRQVISTTTEVLFPLVVPGQFDETLYHRLNVILLRAEAADLEEEAEDECSSTTRTIG